MGLDILFIHPNASKKIYQDLSKDHSAYEPPIWAGMLANHCKKKNFKTEILDCDLGGGCLCVFALAQTSQSGRVAEPFKLISVTVLRKSIIFAFPTWPSNSWSSIIVYWAMATGLAIRLERANGDPTCAYEYCNWGWPACVCSWGWGCCCPCPGTAQLALGVDPARKESWR